ncbi:MAG TPA: YkgJ family cysteine cluster protein [Gemmatales bacterium]|nr:YkgJ family cysteine cluster protein [Gemmatales bacterium]
MASRAFPRMTLKILGEEISAQAEVPGPLGRLDEVLPLLLELDQQSIELAVRNLPTGKQVSCTKGCSACCRAQPVPITPPEAYALMRLIEALPEEQRYALEQKFSEHEAALKQADILGLFLRENPIQDAKQAREAVEAYIRLKLVCPFLVEDSCSIHPQRPFVCRQYLVTSDPSLCNDPLHEPVEVVSMPLRPAHAMLQVTEQFLHVSTGTIPLVLALAYVRKWRSQLEKALPIKQVIETWIQSVAAS